MTSSLTQYGEMMGAGREGGGGGGMTEIFRGLVCTGGSGWGGIDGLWAPSDGEEQPKNPKAPHPALLGPQATLHCHQTMPKPPPKASKGYLEGTEKSVSFQ